MNLLKDLSEDELKNKIEELNDPFFSYAYVKELEQRQKPRPPLKRIVKWLTLDSMDGERSIKQHAFIAKIKTAPYSCDYSGNISLCGKIVATREGPEELAIEEIDSEPLDESNVCKTCLQKAT